MEGDNDTPNTTRLRESMMMILNDLESPGTPEMEFANIDLSCYTGRKESNPNATFATADLSSCLSSAPGTPEDAAAPRPPLREANGPANTTTSAPNKSVRFESPAAAQQVSPASSVDNSSFTAVTPPGSPSQSWMVRAHEELTPARARVSRNNTPAPKSLGKPELSDSDDEDENVAPPAPALAATPEPMAQPVQPPQPPPAQSVQPKRAPPVFPKSALYKTNSANSAAASSKPSPLSRRENAVVAAAAIAAPATPSAVAAASMAAAAAQGIKTASKKDMFAAAPEEPAAADAAPASLNETWITTDKAQQVLQSAKMACTGRYSPRTMKQMREKESQPRKYTRHEPEVSFLDKVRKFQEKAEESRLDASRIAFGQPGARRPPPPPPRSTRPVIITKKTGAAVYAKGAKTRSNLLRMQLERSLNRSKDANAEDSEWEDMDEEEEQSSIEISHVSFEVSQIPFEVSQARISAPSNTSCRHVSFCVPAGETIPEDNEDDEAPAAQTTPTQPTALGQDAGDQDLSFSPLDITQQDLEMEHLVRSSRAEAVLARLRGDLGTTPIKLPRGCDANFIERAMQELQELKKSNVMLGDAFKKLEAANQDLRRQLRQTRHKAEYLNKSTEQSILAAEFELQQERQDMHFKATNWEVERDQMRARIQALERDVSAKREEIFALKAAAAMEQVPTGGSDAPGAATGASATASAGAVASCAGCKAAQDEVAKITSTWQKTVSKLQCATTELQLTTERANSAEQHVATLTASWDSYKADQERLVLSLNERLSERDMHVVELKACLELLRKEKDELAATVALAKQTQKSRDQFTSTLYGLRKEELYTMLSDQDQQLQAAQTEVVRLRKRLKDINERTTRERSAQQRTTTDLKTKMYNLQCLLRDLEEKNPNMTRQFNDSSIVQFPGETTRFNTTQDGSFSLYDNIRPGTSFMLEQSTVTRPRAAAANARQRGGKKRNLFQRIRDKLRRRRRHAHEISMLNRSTMFNRSNLNL